MYWRSWLLYYEKSKMKRRWLPGLATTWRRQGWTNGENWRRKIEGAWGQARKRVEVWQWPRRGIREEESRRDGWLGFYGNTNSVWQSVSFSLWSWFQTKINPPSRKPHCLLSKTDPYFVEIEPTRFLIWIQLSFSLWAELYSPILYLIILESKQWNPSFTYILLKPMIINPLAHVFWATPVCLWFVLILEMSFNLTRLVIQIVIDFYVHFSKE